MSVETLTVAEQPLQEETLKDRILPLAVAVPEIADDAESRHRAAAFIGRVAINEGKPSVAEQALAVKPIESLYHAIHEAAQGNEEARKMVKMNARTDVVERTMKSGHVIKVDLMVDEAGTIQQHGQTMESVQANSLRFAASSPQMRPRIEAETANLFRLKQRYEQGILDDYCFVVFSRAADNMNKEAMEEAGFFTDTMSCAIQVTTAENGRLTMESAFVSGVKSPSAERHDQETVRGVVSELGVEQWSDDATEGINTPILIHKSKLKNGAIDLVELWDKHVPKEEGEEVFFGETRGPQDYLEYLEVCKQREKRFEPKVQNITNQLIRDRHQIKTLVDATRRLHKISGQEMIEQALGDTDINPMVFGPVAAIGIQEARIAFEEGRYEDAINHVNIAKANDRSDSCPGGPSSLDKDGDSSDVSSKKCKFTSKQCPECGKKNVETTVTATHIKGKCGCVKRKSS